MRELVSSFENRCVKLKFEKKMQAVSGVEYTKRLMHAEDGLQAISVALCCFLQVNIDELILFYAYFVATDTPSDGTRDCTNLDKSNVYVTAKIGKH